ELADLVPGQFPVAGVDRPGLRLFIENEAPKGRFRAGDVGADVANDECDVVGMTLGIEGPLAIVVGELYQENHGEQDESRSETRGRGPATAPIEAHFVPVPDHCRNLAALTFWRKPKVPCSRLSLCSPLH